MKKQLLFLVLMMLPMVASADDSGTCGENLTWTYVENTGTLTIIGNGDMYNYSSTEPSPWFSYAMNINNLIISDGVTSIGEFAFEYCRVSYVDIPNSIVKIGKFAFSHCSNLATINIPNSITAIKKCTFGYCKSLRWINIPNSITEINNSAFTDCTGLTVVTIPQGVNKVDSYAFQNCSNLKYLILEPEKCNITSSAFNDCSLKQIICKSKTAGVSAFSSNAVVYVPQGTVELYKNRWKNFSKMVEETDPNVCTRPIISYNNRILLFKCPTEDATFYSQIIASDDNEYNYTNEIQLGTTYHVIVYSKKNNYVSSPISTATLCWIDATPQTEGITDGVAQIAARPVLVKTDKGFITVEGADDRTNVSIYTTDGKQVGSTISQNNVATIATNIQSGSIAIVKVGEKAIKVVMR